MFFMFLMIFIGSGLPDQGYSHKIMKVLNAEQIINFMATIPYLFMFSLPF